MKLTRYREIVITDALPLPPDAEVTAVEQELGVDFPASFKEFLIASHGGHLAYSFDAGEETCLLGNVFRLGLDNRGEYGYGTVLGELRELRDVFSLPKEVLPFAVCGGDINLFLDLTEEGQGRIVAFLEGLPEWAGSREESEFVEVASSFEDFLISLRLDEEEIMEDLQSAIEKKNREWHETNIEYLNFCLPEWKMKYPDDAAEAQNTLQELK